MRRIQVFEYAYTTVDGRRQWVRDEVTKAAVKRFRAHGTFHGFSTTFTEFESGPGQYPVALVEFDDGAVEAVELELIKFNVVR